MCQGNTYFAQKPLGAKESQGDVARSARRAESHSSAALPTLGSGVGAGSFPLPFAPPAAPSQVSFMMLFWIPHSTSCSTASPFPFHLKHQSSVGCSNSPLAREAVPMWSSRSCSTSRVVQTSSGSALFPGAQQTSLQQRNRKTDS